MMPVEAAKLRCYQVRFIGIKQIIPIHLYSHESAVSNLGSKFNLLVSVLDSDNSDNTCCAAASQGTAESTRLCPSTLRWTGIGRAMPVHPPQRLPACPLQTAATAAAAPAVTALQQPLLHCRRRRPAASLMLPLEPPSEPLPPCSHPPPLPPAPLRPSDPLAGPPPSPPSSLNVGKL
jgi:hypothetical protein